MGQQFVIENRPGGGGNIATEAVVRAAPDGYTLLYVTTANASNATLYDKLNFNFVRDIAPIAPIVRFPYIMVVNPSVPAKTLPEFIAYAKANPGKINMASPGIGSTPHVNGELFKVMTGTNIVHVPYRSLAAVMTDLLSGQVQLEPADILERRRLGRSLQKRREPLATADVASLRARTQLARIHIFDHTLTQRGDGLGCHRQLLSWMRLLDTSILKTGRFPRYPRSLPWG